MKKIIKDEMNDPRLIITEGIKTKMQLILDSHVKEVLYIRIKNNQIKNNQIKNNNAYINTLNRTLEKHSIDDAHLYFYLKESTVYHFLVKSEPFFYSSKIKNSYGILFPLVTELYNHEHYKNYILCFDNYQNAYYDNYKNKTVVKITTIKKYKNKYDKPLVTFYDHYYKPNEDYIEYYIYDDINIKKQINDIKKDLDNKNIILFPKKILSKDDIYTLVAYQINIYAKIHEI